MAGQVGQARETGNDAVPGRMKRRGLIAGAAALIAALAVRGGTDPERVAADGFNWSMPYKSGAQNQAGVLAGFYNNGTGTGLTGSSSGHGVLGNTNAVNGTSYAGVYGIGNGGNTSGVYGYGLTTGAGVIGTSGNSAGVIGNSTSGIGVLGQSTSDAGVRGYSQTNSGVYGYSGSGAGLYGVGGTSGNGVYGISQDFHGVSGTTNATPASPSVYPTAGVFGLAYNENTAGVTGSNLGGVGVSGYSAASTGVVGRSQSGFGLYGSSVNGYGVVASVGSGGVAAVYASSSSPNTPAFYAVNYAAPNPPNSNAGFFIGQVYINGPLVIAGGAKSAAVPHPDGTHRLLYCMESPESWFEDFGTGTISGGKAEVKLDPDFAAVVDTAKLHVFLTAHDEHHLHIAGKGAAGFSVQATLSAPAQAAGKKAGDLSGSFTYRVVAKRKDVAAPRLAKFDLPQPKPIKLPATPPTPKDTAKPTAVTVPAPPPMPPMPPTPDKKG